MKTPIRDAALQQVEGCSVKRCTACHLTKLADEFYRRRTGELLSTCRLCVREAVQRWRASNPEKVRQQHQRQSNAQRHARRAGDRAARCLRWKAANADRVRELVRLAATNARHTLNDSYVRNLLIGAGCPRDRVTHELIAMKREQLTLHRLVKRLQSEVGDGN